MEAAEEGKLVIAGREGNFGIEIDFTKDTVEVIQSAGHVAVVVPESAVDAGNDYEALGCVWSTSTKGSIAPHNGWPLVMQAGNSLGFGGINRAWGKNERNTVEYFIYKNGCGCKE